MVFQNLASEFFIKMKTKKLFNTAENDSSRGREMMLASITILVKWKRSLRYRPHFVKAGYIKANFIR